MPEGDTVWHTAANLREALAGKTLTRCDVRVPKFATVDLTGQVVDEVISRGKHLFIRVGDGQHPFASEDGRQLEGQPGQQAEQGRPPDPNHPGDGRIQAAGIDLGVLGDPRARPRHGCRRPSGSRPARRRLGPARRGGEPDRRPRPAAGRGAAGPAGDGRRRQRLLQRVVLRHRASADRARRAMSRIRCGWCSGRGTCCGSTGPGSNRTTTGDTRPGRDLWVYGRVGRRADGAAR